MTWDDLLAKYGEIVTCFGAETKNYWESGMHEWENVIAPRLCLPEMASVMEWGAGSGRIARAAAGNVVQLWAYEPSGAVRTLLADNLAGTGAEVIGPEGLPTVPPLDALYCVFTMHHMDYDALWEFFGFANEHLAAGGTLLFDYIPITTPVGRGFLARKDTCEWPFYIWHPAQIAALMAARTPRLSLAEVVDRPRELQVWRAK